MFVLRVHNQLKYPQLGNRPTDLANIGDLPNFFFWTNSADGGTQAQLESGINPMKSVNAPDGQRRPVVLVRTSPRKAGTSETPWHDLYDMDKGRVRYFGDAKAKHRPNPTAAPGNRALLEIYQQHRSPLRDVRARSCPIAFFVTERPGVVEFRGIGLIESVDLVTQIEPKSGQAFSNYVFDCSLISLAEEGEIFQWDWITKRRDISLHSDIANQSAPKAWQQWIDEGWECINRIRRVVSRQGVVNKTDQQPSAKSGEEKVLREVFDFYSSDGNRRKHRFEALAEIVAAFVLSEGGAGYREGWITRGTGDHGIDFVGRLDIGRGFSSTSLVVLGQAKCEALDSATNGKDIARTVARLRRGWIGCYVTTGTFSISTQQEVLEDRYPIILIPGLEVARAVRTIALRDGIAVKELLRRVDESYESRIRDREPEQVLML